MSTENPGSSFATPIPGRNTQRQWWEWLAEL